MKFEITRDSFKIDGKDLFLMSGEIHYFRTPCHTWDTHLARLKECGAKAVSFYIPWSWHEYEKDRYDFEGATDPGRNLAGWLDAVKKSGLCCIAKPGPYMLAEYEDKGIPAWLAEHKDILSSEVDMVTYMHGTYLERVGKWYDRVLEILKPCQFQHGGPLVMMQVCNEIGLFNWLEGSPDYSDTVTELYREYLGNKWKEIRHFNKVYNENYRQFDDVCPPGTPPANLPELAMWIDFHDFHRWYFARYIGYLKEEIRRRGIDVPLYHNIAGWVYGQALEYPVNISMYREIAKSSPEILLATDHIPENLSYRNIHHGTLVTRAVSALKQGRELPYVAEMQAGTREDSVTTYPSEMELFYKKSLADGIKGMNLYMFSQGQNPRHRGAFGPTFYWQTVLDYNAKKLPLFDTVHRLGRMLDSFGDSIVTASKKADVGVVFYWPYWQTEFFYPLFERKTLVDPPGLGIDFDMKHYREALLMETWIKLTDRANINYDIVDLQGASPENLNSYKNLILLSLPFMDRESQDKLARYVKDGGHLFFGPSVPKWDLSFQDCHELGRSLEVRNGHRIQEAKIDIAGFEYISCMAPVFSIESGKDSQILAVSSTQRKTCGIHRQVEKGSFTCLSGVFSHVTEEHAEIFDSLVLKKITKGRIQCSDPGISASYLYSPSGSWLFAGNVHREEVQGTISIPDLPEEEIPITLAPLASIFAPLDFPLPGESGRIIYSTGDIIHLKQNKNNTSLTMEIFREKGAQSEILMELSFKPAGFMLDGGSLVHQVDEKGRILLKPEHTGEIQTIAISR